MIHYYKNKVILRLPKSSRKRKAVLRKVQSEVIESLKTEDFSKEEKAKILDFLLATIKAKKCIVIDVDEKTRERLNVVFEEGK